MSKHKFTLAMVRELFKRYLDTYTCNRNDYLSIQWVAKGKRFVVFKHRSHVEYGKPEASKVGHGSATCPVHYELYDLANPPKGNTTINHKNALLSLEGRWCQAHENAVDEAIIKTFEGMDNLTSPSMVVSGTDVTLNFVTKSLTA